MRQKTAGLKGRSQRALPGKLAGVAGSAQQWPQGQGQGTGVSVHVKAALDFPTVHSPSGKVVLGQGNQPGDQVINARAGRDRIFNSYLHKKGRWKEGPLFWAPPSEAKGWQGPGRRRLCSVVLPLADCGS